MLAEDVRLGQDIVPDTKHRHVPREPLPSFRCTSRVEGVKNGVDVGAAEKPFWAHAQTANGRHSSRKLPVGLTREGAISNESRVSRLHGAPDKGRRQVQLKRQRRSSEA